MKRIIPLTIASVLLLSTSLKAENLTKVNAEAKVRYNLCVFLRFNDEEDYINDQVTSNQKRREIIDQTYNGDTYSIRDYYNSLSSNKVNLKTVYLFPNATGFDSFYLDGAREIYAKQSSTNPNGYTNIYTASELFIQDWSSKIQQAINNNILPCSMSSRSDTIPYEDLDSNGDGLIDCITLAFSPQEQTHFTCARQEPLYPCEATTQKITINTGNKKLTSYNYNQWVPNYESIIRTEDSTSYFLPFATGAHEMGHTFGYLDLYDYYQRIFPVGYMSLMSNLINPIPQYMTSYEREISGWLNKDNVHTITSSGTYTLTPVMSNNQTGIVTYKIPILEAEDKWVYFEYRNFSNKEINKYDARNKGLFYSNGNAVESISGKSGVVVYIVDKDNGLYPTNSHGLAKHLGIEVLGGDTSSKNRSDAPRIEGDTLSILCYDKNEAIVHPEMYVTIGEITETSAKFTIDYKSIDNLQQVTREDINNDKLFNALSSIKDTPFYNNTFDDQELLNLASLDIDNLSFLSLFDFKNLKYLVLFGNNISNLEGLNDFVSSHPNTIIILDNNKIKLSLLDEETLNLQKVFYGLQNTQENTKYVEYFINSSFTYDYQICYEFEGEGYWQKSLKNEGYGTLEMIDNTKISITSYYFFTSSKYLSFKYDFMYVPTIEIEPITVSLNGEETISLEYGETYIEKGVSTNYPDSIEITITLNDQTVEEIYEVGIYIVTYTVSNGSETKSLTRTVIVVDSTAPRATLIGDSEYIGLSYQEFGVDSYDLSGNCSVNIVITNEENQIVSETNECGHYLITYNITDANANSTTLSRTVIILSPEEAVTNSAFSDYFDTQVEYYNMNNEKLDKEPVEGDYIIKYIITDKYGNTTSYTEQKHLSPNTGGDVSSEEETSQDSSSQDSSSQESSNNEISEQEASISKASKNDTYVPFIVISASAVLVLLITLLIIKKRK